MVFVMRTTIFAMVGLLLVTSTVQADSYVYITNSTAEHVAVDVKHFSSGSLLTMGSQWRQEATAIPPYATHHGMINHACSSRNVFLCPVFRSFVRDCR